MPTLTVTHKTTEPETMYPICTPRFTILYHPKTERYCYRVDNVRFVSLKSGTIFEPESLDTFEVVQSGTTIHLEVL